MTENWYRDVSVLSVVGDEIRRRPMSDFRRRRLFQHQVAAGLARPHAASSERSRRRRQLSCRTTLTPTPTAAAVSATATCSYCQSRHTAATPVWRRFTRNGRPHTTLSVFVCLIELSTCSLSASSEHETRLEWTRKRSGTSLGQSAVFCCTGSSHLCTGVSHHLPAQVILSSRVFVGWFVHLFVHAWRSFDFSKRKSLIWRRSPVPNFTF